MLNTIKIGTPQQHDEFKLIIKKSYNALNSKHNYYKNNNI